MKKWPIILIMLVLNIVLTTAFEGVYESIYPPEPSDETAEPEPSEKPESGCITDFDCNKGEHKGCNTDGTEENYFCIEDYDTLISNCGWTVKRSYWCSVKFCEKDDDCYITTAITPETLIDYETYDCCNSTIDAFNIKPKENWDKELKYYFRDYCPKQKLNCDGPADIANYKAVCKENICQAIKEEVTPKAESVETPEIMKEIPKGKVVEVKKEIQKEIETEEKTEIPATEEPIEEKKPYIRITKRIFEWILRWFR